MKLITPDQQINRPELADMAQQMFGNLVKAVVDIKRGVMAVDAELHADEEAYLIENGSEQNNLWGINLYPELPAADWLEYDSMINLRPSQGNRSRDVEDPEVREQIKEIVSKLVSS